MEQLQAIEETVSEDGVASFSRLQRTGRPPFDVTEENRDLVTALRINGVTEDEIAETLGIDPKTLRKYFRDELDHGKRMAVGKVARALYRQAIKADTGDKTAMTAAIFLLKTQGKWREEEKAQAPTVNLQVFVNNLPDGEREEFKAKLRAAWELLQERKALGDGGGE